jgi:hypothetical protein
VTANVSGPATRKLRVEQVGDRLEIETLGEWEGAAMATLLRGLAEAMQSG